MGVGEQDGEHARVAFGCMGHLLRRGRGAGRSGAAHAQGGARDRGVPGGGGASDARRGHASARHCGAGGGLGGQGYHSPAVCHVARCGGAPAHARGVCRAHCRATRAGQGRRGAHIGRPRCLLVVFYLADGLRDRGFAIEVIPGVTSFSAVAARLGEGLTEMDEPLHVVPSAACVDRIDEVLDLSGTKVLMKPCGKLGELIEALERRGELPCASLVADCGLPSEHVCRDLASFDPAEHPSYFTTLVVK